MEQSLKRVRTQRSVSGVPLRSTHLRTSLRGESFGTSESAVPNTLPEQNGLRQSQNPAPVHQSYRHSAPAGTFKQESPADTQHIPEAYNSTESAQTAPPDPSTNVVSNQDSNLVDPEEERVMNLSFGQWKKPSSSARRRSKRTDQTASAQRSSEASSPPSVPEGTQKPTDLIANPMGPDGAPQPTEHSAHPSEDDVAAEPQQDTLEMVDDTQQIQAPAGVPIHEQALAPEPEAEVDTSDNETTSGPILDDDLFQTIDPREYSSDESDNDYSEGEGESSNISSVLFTRLRRLVTWDRMLANVSFSGRRAMTAAQFQLFSASITGANPCVKLITYKTIRTTHWRVMLRHCFPDSKIYHLSTLPRARATAAPVKTVNAGLQDPADCARVILPSEWAKLDVLTLPFYEEVFGGNLNSRPGSMNIEYAPIVQHRSVLTGHKLTLWAEYDDAVCPCEKGDVIRFPCNNGPAGQSSEEIAASWVCGARHNGITHGSHTLVQGCIDFMWSVQENSCAPDNDCMEKEMKRLSPDEVSILNILRSRHPLPIRTQDTSSTHAQHMNSSGRGKKRKQAMIEEVAIPDELRLYPGDTCAFIRPVGARNTTKVCIFVASLAGRSIGATSERLSWVVPGQTREKRYIRVCADATVRGIPTWIKGRRSRPTFPDRPVRNRGRLENGRLYLVYRLALYGDGFRQHKSLTDSRQVGGCYMLPLGLPPEARRSSCSTRVISLSPAGHSINEVFHLIHDDLVK